MIVGLTKHPARPPERKVRLGLHHPHRQQTKRLFRLRPEPDSIDTHDWREHDSELACGADSSRASRVLDQGDDEGTRKKTKSFVSSFGNT